MQTVQIEPILQFSSKARTLSPSGTQQFVLQGELANILALQSNNIKSGFATHRPIVSTNVQIPWTSSRLLQGIASRYGYDRSLLPHGISLQNRCADGGQSFDLALLAGVRRKNATRETTNALKTWLNEHRKNPYPTKGEKIMLAILTKMTLTQVSTWFANARRRLKKENKMTWLPKNKSSDKGRDSSASGGDADDSDNDMSSATDDDDEMLEDEEQHATDVDRPVLCRRSSPTLPSAPPREPSYHPPEATSHSAKRQQQQQQRAEQRSTLIRRSPIVTVQLDSKGTGHECFDTSDSPVTSLRRWVDDCFEKEEQPDVTSLALTPPQTPVDKVVPQPESNESSVPVIHEERERDQVRRHSTSVSVITSVEKRDLKTTEDVVAKALETSPFQLTTNREMDAVLALTTLCSR